MIQCTCSKAEYYRDNDEPWSIRPKKTSPVQLQVQPPVYQLPLCTLRSWCTQNWLFNVRNHFYIPPVELSGTTLSVVGHVAHAFQLTYSQTHGFPKQTLPVTLECVSDTRLSGGFEQRASAMEV